MTRRIAGSLGSPNHSVQSSPPLTSTMYSVTSAPLRSEAVTGVAEGPLAEAQDLRWPHGEHERLPGFVTEAAVLHLVVPAPVPLRAPRLGEAFEHRVICHPRRIAFDDDIQSPIPAVAPGGQDHARIGLQVDGLLLARARRKVNGLVEPHGDERGDVRSTVVTDRRDPEQLSGLQHSKARGPIS